MKIKEIFDEIAAEGGTNAKVAILTKYVDNELLKRVLYLANSKRVALVTGQLTGNCSCITRLNSVANSGNAVAYALNCLPQDA